MKTITRDVQMLYFYRDIFLGVHQIVEKNERIDKRSLFFSFFANIYIDSVVMGIRRQCKKKRNDDSVSLAKLLSEIAKHPELITRSNFNELYRNSNSPVKETYMREDFNRFADPGSSHIDGARVEKDIETLKDECKKAETYADKRVAHWDEKTLIDDLKWDDVLKPLDVLGDMVKRYNLLLLGLDVEIHPVPWYPIYHIFEEPWSVQSHSTSPMS